jgi:hypothetical protein
LRLNHCRRKAAAALITCDAAMRAASGSARCVRADSDHSVAEGAVTYDSPHALRDKGKWLWAKIEKTLDLARYEILSKMARMKLAAPFSSEQTIIGHGVYLMAVALLLFFAPGALRRVFAFPVEFGWWNRILALPVFNLGLFCIASGFLKSRTLIKLTIAMRMLVMVAHTAPPLALGIGIIDIASAALTAWAIETPRRAT